MISTLAAIMMRASSVFNYFLLSCRPLLHLPSCYPGPPGPPGSAHDSGARLLTAGVGGCAPQDQGLSHGGGFGVSTLVPFHLLSLLLLDKPDVVTHHQNVITTTLNPVALTYTCALGLPACTRKYFHLNRSDECDHSELLQHS